SVSEEQLDSFDGLPEDLRAGIADLGWTQPMPVQARVVPIMQRGGDLIVQARTGSGKTGAFGIPIISAVDKERAQPQALVMAPAGELAIQVCGEIEAMGRHRGVRTLPIYGGVGYGPQIEALRAGVHVVVGTPGRMLDHLNAGRLSFAAIKVVVLVD